MQSGTRQTEHWEMRWAGGERWLNPLMGWTSTSDPLTTLKIRFDTRDEAVAYAEKYNLVYEVEPEHPIRLRKRSYDDNFRYKAPRDDSVWQQ